jgi:hypothetical protein
MSDAGRCSTLASSAQSRRICVDCNERIVSQLASLHGRLEELWRQEQREGDEPTGIEPKEDVNEEDETTISPSMIVGSGNLPIGFRAGKGGAANVQ